ncbi:hypothetical protein BC332_32129 [Capsicum chinense]|nr:hypothetical protein BC332_32129 [Capsicum chinense]
MSICTSSPLMTKQSGKSIRNLPVNKVAMVIQMNGKLQKFRQPITVGRLSIQFSLSTTNQIINSINDFLNPIELLLPKSTISALQDCQYLLGLNVDLLSNAAVVAKKPNNSLENTEADNVLARLSATITNKQTCLDGLLAAPSILQAANLITPLISKGTSC